jgi:hypothetical protein
MFLSAVSGGLVALGLVATATRVGTACYAFGLALLPTLTFVGLVTFERVLQTGIEDHDYARRRSRRHAGRSRPSALAFCVPRRGRPRQGTAREDPN